MRSLADSSCYSVEFSNGRVVNCLGAANEPLKSTSVTNSLLSKLENKGKDESVLGTDRGNLTRI